MSLNDEYHAPMNNMPTNHDIMSDEEFRLANHGIPRCKINVQMPPCKTPKKPSISDAELIALAALASIEAIQNCWRESISGDENSPAYTAGILMEAGHKLDEELRKRGIL